MELEKLVWIFLVYPNLHITVLGFIKIPAVTSAERNVGESNREKETWECVCVCVCSGSTSLPVMDDEAASAEGDEEMERPAEGEDKGGAISSKMSRHRGGIIAALCILKGKIHYREYRWDAEPENNIKEQVKGKREME